MDFDLVVARDSAQMPRDRVLPASLGFLGFSSVNFCKAKQYLQGHLKLPAATLVIQWKTGGGATNVGSSECCQGVPDATRSVP